MKKILSILLCLFAGAIPGALAQPPAAELLAKPQYVTGARRPVFKKVDVRTVREGVKIISARHQAVFGFNAPKVVVYLPNIDNSAYALLEFRDPEPMDFRGRPVPFERETGVNDDRTRSAEIRLLKKNGQGPVEFARVRGSGKITYPLEITTGVFTKTKSPAGPGDPVIDGPLVTYVDPNIEEMFFIRSRLGPVRAYDASGRQLARNGYNKSVTENNLTRRTLAFYGDIEAVHIDAVRRWVELEFDYELPPAKELPEDAAGRPATRPSKIIQPPGGKTSVRLRTPKPDPAAQGPSRAAPSSGMDPLKKFPLHTAVTVFPQDQVLRLIASGGEVNGKDDAGRTPLHLAAYRCDRVKIVRALLDAGAQVNVQTPEGHTPLWLADQMNCREIKTMLLKAGAR